jgi:hypothetical protein
MAAAVASPPEQCHLVSFRSRNRSDLGQDAEARFVDAVWNAGNIRASLVAIKEGQVVSCILFSDSSITPQAGTVPAGKGSGDQKAEVQILSGLASVAAEEGFSFRQALVLLRMQEQIIAQRKTAKRNGLDKVDWREFYQAVETFL